MADAERELDEVLKDAHLPALIVAMVQLTGDDGWLRPEWTPTYSPLDRNDPGIPADEQAKIRELAKAAILARPPGAEAKIPVPDTALLRRMMDFVAGAPIPEGYAAFLLDELALSGVQQGPAVRAAPAEGGRAQAEGAGGRRRHVGHPDRHPAVARPASSSRSSRRTPTSAAPGW